MSETRIVLRFYYPFHPKLSHPWCFTTVRCIVITFRRRTIARLSCCFTVIKMCIRLSTEILGMKSSKLSAL